MKRWVKVLLGLLAAFVLIVVIAAASLPRSAVPPGGSRSGFFLSIDVADDVCWTGGYAMDSGGAVIIGGCGPEDVQFFGCEILIGWSFGTDNGEPIDVRVLYPGGIDVYEGGTGRWDCRTPEGP